MLQAAAEVVETPSPAPVDSAVAAQARYEGVGWCPSCEDYTTEGIEPTDSGKLCVQCGDDRVCGVSHAIVAGFIELADVA